MPASLTHISSQVNARKIYDEPNVLEGVFENKLFVGILASELALQVRLLLPTHLLACPAG